jgi:tetratricopeptide (TPR) repeat protein
LPAVTAVPSTKPPLPEAVSPDRPAAPPPLLAKVVADAGVAPPRPIEVKPPPIAAQARIASSNRADDATALIDVRETRNTDDWRAPTLRPAAVRRPIALYAALAGAAAILLFAWMRGGAKPDAPARKAPTEAVTPEPKAPEAPSAAPDAPVAAPEQLPSAAAVEPAALAATTQAEPAPAMEAAPAAEAPAPTPAPPAAEGGGDALDAEAVLERARKLDEQNKPKQALKVYEEAAQRLPVNSTVLGRLAFAYLNRGRDADAVQYAAKAVELDPTNSEGWIVLGAGKFQLGDRKAAKEAYKACAEQGKGTYVAECKRMNR